MQYESQIHEAIQKAMEEETSSAIYMDGGKWIGWTRSEESGKYYFDDIGSDTIVNEMEILFEMEETMKCNDCGEVAVQEVDSMYFCDECIEEYAEEE
jgi:Zn finger protein HypA/HybF involved in hydrogenase expression